MSLTAEAAGVVAGHGRSQGVDRASRRVAHLLLALLFVASVTWLVISLLRWSDTKGPATAASEGDAAVVAARTQALNIMTLNYKTAKADLQRVIDASTGTMQKGYKSGAPGQISNATGTKSVSTGTIISAGLSYPKGQSSLGKGKAEVLVAGDALVAFPQSGKTAASKVLLHYRLRFEMVKQGNTWKSSVLSFAGLPTPEYPTS